MTNDITPFRRAESLDTRLKVFLWGDSGVGKTTLSLQFPKPAVIDLEGGTDLYGDSFDFDVLHVTTADDVMESVEWLHGNEHSHDRASSRLLLGARSVRCQRGTGFFARGFSSSHLGSLPCRDQLVRRDRTGAPDRDAFSVDSERHGL